MKAVNVCVNTSADITWQERVADGSYWRIYSDWISAAWFRRRLWFSFRLQWISQWYSWQRWVSPRWCWTRYNKSAFQGVFYWKASRCHCVALLIGSHDTSSPGARHHSCRLHSSSQHIRYKCRSLAFFTVWSEQCFSSRFCGYRRWAANMLRLWIKSSVNEYLFSLLHCFSTSIHRCIFLILLFSWKIDYFSSIFPSFSKFFPKVVIFSIHNELLRKN